VAFAEKLLPMVRIRTVLASPAKLTAVKSSRVKLI
jgi:hypothetical protein